MFERASIVELSQLANVLQPPAELGPYTLTAQLKQSATSLLFTATGGPFERTEGVLKLTTSHHAPRLRAEVDRLVRCADSGVSGIIQPLKREPDWLPVTGLLDAYVAVLPLPFLTGGDLYAFRRAGARQLSPSRLAHETALSVGATLKHLLELPEPMTHGGLNPRTVLLPRPDAQVSELLLIDLGAACDLVNVSRAEAANRCREDVVAFGKLLSEIAPGAGLNGVVARCQRGEYTSLRDPRLWRSLTSPRGTWLSRLWSRQP